MKPITKAWLERAWDDLEAIKQLLKNEYLTNVVSFHAQQTVEKSLKAVIEELEIGFVKTHNLPRLYELVKPHYDLRMVHNLVGTFLPDERRMTIDG